jgi:hypothetical protein
MADVETKIKRTLAPVREAIKAIEADAETFNEAVRRLEAHANRSFEIPADRPEAALKEIERILANALERLDTL